MKELINGLERRVITGFVLFLMTTSAFSQSWVQSDVIGQASGNEGDLFGYSLSQYNDIMAVGASYHGFDLVGGNEIDNAGAVFIYIRNSNGKWELSQKLLAPTRVENAKFGTEVCVYGDYLFVHSAETVNTYVAAGKIYVFLRVNGKYYYVQTLVSRDPEYIEYFGYVMAANSNYLFVGTGRDSRDENGEIRSISPGSVRVFKLNSAGSWEFTQRISPTEGDGQNFGSDVALTAGGVLIGASNYRYPNGDQAIAGKVYYYEYDQYGLPKSWKMKSSIMNPDPQTGDRFGHDISCDGSLAAIGSFGEDYDENGENNLNSAGAVYIYQQHPITKNWTFQKKLVAKYRKEGSLFGQALSLNGDFLAVGSWNESYDENGENDMGFAGAVWLFSKKTGNWELNQKVVLANRNESDGFGFKISLFQGAMATSAIRSDYFGLDRGAVYCYDYQPAVGIQTLGLESQVNVFPNPADDNVNISLNLSSSPAGITIRSVSGSRLLTLTTTRDHLSVDIRAYPAGIYYLQIETKQGVVIKKLIHH